MNETISATERDIIQIICLIEALIRWVFLPPKHTTEPMIIQRQEAEQAPRASIAKAPPRATDRHTVKELRAMCQKRGITHANGAWGTKRYTAATKAQLIEAINRDLV